MKRSLMLALAGLGLLVSPSLGAGAGPGEVTGVSVLPSGGRALVVIDVRGSVGVQDFTLAHPARLVIDVQGARLRVPSLRYDGTNRGGILNIRYSQFRPDVVRIVLELESLKDYELEYFDDAIRISFGTDRHFTAWSSVAPTQYASVAPVMPMDTELEPPPSQQPTPQQSQQPVVTASFDNTSIAEVMVGFAELSGRTIVLGKDVSGTVTAEIRNQPWDVAFRAVLSSQGLAAVEDPSGIIRVDSPEILQAQAQVTAGPRATEVIRINFANAAAIATTLEGVKMAGDSVSEGESIVADIATNSLIVTATPTRLESIKGLIGSLDVETPQVSIQARIITISRTDLEQLGLEYDFADGRSFYNTSVTRQDPNNPGEFFDPTETPFLVLLGGQTVAGVANAGRAIATPALDILASVSSGRFTFTAFLRVLKEVSLADEQAEPLVSTADNTEATILVGEETPIRIVDAGAAGAGAASIQMIATGISLTVTPHVTANRKIMLDIIAEKSSAEEVATDLGFKFIKQKVESHILVNDGQTAVIGGLTQTSVTVVRSGIPYLMELPIIGQLFSVNSRREERKDLLVLVTPRIIDNPNIAGGRE